jgi:hypothetical protein
MNAKQTSKSGKPSKKASAEMTKKAGIAAQALLKEISSSTKKAAKATKAKKEQPKAAAPAAPKLVPMAPAKKETIQDYACRLLVDEFDVNKVLEAVLKKFPDAKTTVKCIYWYRSRMNRSLM